MLAKSRPEFRCKSDPTSVACSANKVHHSNHTSYKHAEPLKLVRANNLAATVGETFERLET